MQLYLDICKLESWKEYIERLYKLIDGDPEERDMLIEFFGSYGDETAEMLVDSIKDAPKYKNPWKARHALMELKRVNQANRKGFSYAGKSATLPKDIIENNVLIGDKINSLVEQVVAKIKTAHFMGRAYAIVIGGDLFTGKTHILGHIKTRLEEDGLCVTEAANIRKYKDNSVLQKPDVIIADNLKPAGPMSDTIELLAEGTKINTNIRYVITSRDPDTFSKSLSNMDHDIIKIPDYTDEEMVEIVHHLFMLKGIEISRLSMRRIVYMLKGIGMKGNGILRELYECVATAIVHFKDMLKPDEPIIEFSEELLYRVVNFVTGVSLRFDVDNIYKDFHKRLNSIVIGQEKAIEDVLPTLVNMKSGLVDPTRPAGVFLCVGPTGTGKTELGKAIAELLFDGKFHKEDMNSYTSEHAAYRIIGAPPSFVGYGDVSPILKFVKDNDCGVILLDEMEKAHPVVIDFFIEIFDTGKFTDAAGRSYSFNRFCFILTSNLSYDFGPTRSKQVGFGAQDEQPRGDLKEIIKKYGLFKQSFLGRVRIVEFTHLPERSLRDIARKLLIRMVEHMYNVGFDIRDALSDESIVDEIVARYSQDRGARSMREFVDGSLKHRLIEQYQQMRLQHGYEKGLKLL